MKKLIIPAIAMMMAFAINATDILPLGQTSNTNEETTLIAKRAKKRAKKNKKGNKRGRIIGKSISQLRAMGYRVTYVGPDYGGDLYKINGRYYIVDGGVVICRDGQNVDPYEGISY